MVLEVAASMLQDFHLSHLVQTAHEARRRERSSRASKPDIKEGASPSSEFLAGIAVASSEAD